MFLNQERPEMDNFMIRKKLGCKKNHFNIKKQKKNGKNVLTDTLPTIQNMFTYSFISGHSRNFFLF